LDSSRRDAVLFVGVWGSKTEGSPYRESKPSTQHPHRTHRTHDTTDQWRETLWRLGLCFQGCRRVVSLVDVVVVPPPSRVGLCSQVCRRVVSLADVVVVPPHFCHTSIEVSRIPTSFYKKCDTSPEISTNWHNFVTRLPKYSEFQYPFAKNVTYLLTY